MEEVIRVKDQYYILATSSRSDGRTKVLKDGETFGVFDDFGDVLRLGLGEQGCTTRARVTCLGSSCGSTACGHCS